MTIRIPDSNIGDKILRYFGKKRGLIFPKNIKEQNVHSIYAKAIKENFWKALLRSKNTQLPEDVMDYETFMESFKKIKENKI